MVSNRDVFVMVNSFTHFNVVLFVFRRVTSEIHNNVLRGYNDRHWMMSKIECKKGEPSRTSS